MIIRNKKLKNIIIRISEEDKNKIEKIKEIDSNFNLSYFIRDKILEKYSQNFPGVGILKIG